MKKAVISSLLGLILVSTITGQTLTPECLHIPVQEQETLNLPRVT